MTTIQKFGISKIILFNKDAISILQGVLDLDL